jgi:hypothetical protein
MADHQKILSARPLTHAQKYHDVATSPHLDASEDLNFSMQTKIVTGFENPEFVA